MISVLFVCQANICRSPALQGFMQHIVDKHDRTESYYIDSCGISSSCSLQSVDSYTKIAAQNRGIILSHQARGFQLEDFLIFDYIFAVSKQVKEVIYSLNSADEVRKKIYLATHFSALYKDKDILDPYNEPVHGFEKMMDVVEDVVNSLFRYLENKHGSFN